MNPKKGTKKSPMNGFEPEAPDSQARGLTNLANQSTWKLKLILINIFSNFVTNLATTFLFKN
jgi:hypothetical protein